MCDPTKVGSKQKERETNSELNKHSLPLHEFV